MKLLEIEYPYYKLQDGNVTFEVLAEKYDGRLIFNPTMGWNALASTLNKHPETLLEDIDECIYNGSPEKYEEE
jgi:hypothetical protein